MKALTFQGVQDVRYSTVPDPEILGPTDAIVRIRLAGLCGSDLHPFHGREVGIDRGTVMGHEMVGEIVEIGSEVEHLQVGDRVATPFTTSCGTCFYCRRGLTCRCTAGQLLGWVEAGHGLHGCQAEYVRVPMADSTLVAVPDTVSDEAALLAGDVLSTGFFVADLGLQDLQNHLEETTAVVIGCGPVGLMAVLAAKHLGAGRVFAIDRMPERLELARKFGAEPIDFSRQDARTVIDRATDARGADAALECVGTPEATRAALNLLRPAGTLAAAGVHTEDHLAFSPGEAYDRNLTYRAGRCPARHWMDRVLPLLGEGTLDPTPVLTHRMPLEDGKRAYEIFDGKEDGCVKVGLSG